MSLLTKKFNLFDVFIFGIFITSSFDIFLNINLIGFNIRLCNLLMIFFSIGQILKDILQNKVITIKIIGFGSFLIWYLFLLVFLPNTVLIGRSLGYIMWLSLYAIFISCLANYSVNEQLFQRIIKMYFWSFNIIAVFSIIQFIFGMFGILIYITQMRGSIPRANGFSYEPSYLSTYMQIAWFCHFYFIVREHPIKKIINCELSLILTTIAIVLSTSRMGIGMIFGACIIYVLNVAFQIISTMKVSRKFRGTFVFLIVGVIGMVIYVAVNFKKFQNILDGLPLVSRAAHSYTIRLADFTDTYKIFAKSPFVGYSLGGIAPAICKIRGVISITQDTAKHNEGMCIFLEVLAASGIIGFLFFIYFIFKLYKLPKIINSDNQLFNKSFIGIFLLSLTCEFVILCFNQNILRNYLWLHIGIINAYFFMHKGLNDIKITHSSQINTE